MNAAIIATLFARAALFVMCTIIVFSARRQMIRILGALGAALLAVSIVVLALHVGGIPVSLSPVHW